MKLNQLTLVPLHRTSGDSRSERHSFDFVVDGQSLLKACGADKLDRCGCIAREWVRGEVEKSLQVLTLARRPETISGRCEIFICSECGDIGRGSVTVRVSQTGDVVIWSDFAYETELDEENPETKLFPDLGPFHFKHADYLAAFASIKLN